MNAEQFRRIALSMPGVAEGCHMGHPDFRIRSRIFATIMPLDDALEESSGMVRLTPALQRKFVREHPRMFAPVKGAWGARGYTEVRLKPARVPVVREAMREAWLAAQ